MGAGFLFGPSGGLSYHWSAWRYRHKLWASFRAEVETWLCEEWKPQAKELIIFGSSAGWTLNDRFLSRFDSIVCVEPDPLSRWIFSRRFGHLSKTSEKWKLRWSDRTDLLPWFASHTRDFENWLAEYPAHAILFSNLLGQMPCLDPGFGSNEINKKSFLNALREREWASYHDLLSGCCIHSESGEVLRLAPRDLDVTLSESTLRELASEVFAVPQDVYNHETLWLSEKRRTHFAHWQIRPHQHHLIAFVHS